MRAGFRRHSDHAPAGGHAGQERLTRPDVWCSRGALSPRPPGFFRLPTHADRAAWLQNLVLLGLQGLLRQIHSARAVPGEELGRLPTQKSVLRPIAESSQTSQTAHVGHGWGDKAMTLRIHKNRVVNGDFDGATIEPVWRDTVRATACRGRDSMKGAAPEARGARIAVTVQLMAPDCVLRSGIGGDRPHPGLITAMCPITIREPHLPASPQQYIARVRTRSLTDATEVPGGTPRVRYSS